MKLIISDVHGCYEELISLLDKVGFQKNKDKLYFCGDLVDRGPNSKYVVDICMEYNAKGVIGNHDDKFLRYLKGKNVKIREYLQKTIDDFAGSDLLKYQDWLEKLPVQLETEDFILVHAQPFNRPNRQCMFGTKKEYKGVEVRWNWWDFYQPEKIGLPTKTVIFGHYWFDKVIYRENCIGLDTSAVCGQKLSGLIWETQEIIQIDCKQYFINDYDNTLEKEGWEYWSDSSY